MLDQFSRTQLILGREAMEKLSRAHVAVFGVGGVGGYVCEALVRSGIGTFDLIDNDIVSLTNLNRQIIATQKTIGKYKVDVMKERMLDINPDANIHIHKCFYLPENARDYDPATAEVFDFSQYDYVVDAIDTVSAKIDLVVKCHEKNVSIICAMGAGNKLDPTRFTVADLYKTQICPLARVMRRELKKRGIKKLKVVYSDEEPLAPLETSSEVSQKRAVPGSTAFVPAVCGLIIAGEVIKDLIATPKIAEI